MSQKKQIANLTLKDNQPTKFRFESLYTWTIWRFPRKIEGGFCGAIHPPIPAYGWLPAVLYITEKSKEARIFGHLNQTFASPEAAADFLEKENP